MAIAPTFRAALIANTVLLCSLSVMIVVICYSLWRNVLCDKRPAAKRARACKLRHDSYFCAQNQREYMEDVVFRATGNQTWIGAVMDGHGGSKSAECCRDMVRDAFGSSGSSLPAENWNAHAKKWLAELFAACESTCVRTSLDGTTMVVVLVRMDTAQCVSACIGDSGAIVSGEDAAFFEMYRAHKPDDDMERIGIESRGGFVHAGRANGVLAMSRSIGDARLKPAVSAEPDFFEFAPPAGAPFALVLFSDGLSDVVDNADISERAAFCLKNGVSSAPFSLCDDAIRVGSLDNVSAVYAAFDAR
jgi:serine/threonine protein phosphatase PrpC